MQCEICGRAGGRADLGGYAVVVCNYHRNEWRAFGYSRNEFVRLTVLLVRRDAAVIYGGQHPFFHDVDLFELAEQLLYARLALFRVARDWVGERRTGDSTSEWIEVVE